MSTQPWCTTTCPTLYFMQCPRKRAQDTFSPSHYRKDPLDAARHHHHVQSSFRPGSRNVGETAFQWTVLCKFVKSLVFSCTAPTYYWCWIYTLLRHDWELFLIKVDSICIWKSPLFYRVTIQVVPNLQLTSKQKLCFNTRASYLNVTFILTSTQCLTQPE